MTDVVIQAEVNTGRKNPKWERRTMSDKEIILIHSEPVVREEANQGSNREKRRQMARWLARDGREKKRCKRRR